MRDAINSMYISRSQPQKSWKSEINTCLYTPGEKGTKFSAEVAIIP